MAGCKITLVNTIYERMIVQKLVSDKHALLQ